jgi:PadR family transcriptional regulator AphA
MLTDMSEQLSAPAYVVLGMVALGRRSGYEIKQAVELSIRFFWTISQAQIYPALEQLEAAALVIGRDDPRGKRPRRVYEITEAGEAQLQEWLRHHDSMPFELRDIGLVKLFFADALEPGDSRELLDAVRRRSEQRAQTLRELEPVAKLAAEEDGDLYPLLTLRMGINFHQAMVDACDEFAMPVEVSDRRGSRSAARSRRQ